MIISRPCDPFVSSLAALYLQVRFNLAGCERHQPGVRPAAGLHTQPLQRIKQPPGPRSGASEQLPSPAGHLT